MSFFDAMILGIIQGLTEFLPVSSSGHLVILENLLNIRTDTDVLFHVLLHFGTLIAICLVLKRSVPYVGGNHTYFSGSDCQF